MRGHIKLAKTTLSQNRVKTEIKSAISYLNIKIDDFINSEHKTEAELSEIVGSLKFMYMGNIISSDEYKAVLRYIDDNIGEE